ncbi:RNA dependent RNA polymerase-domain-containing protein [Fennellomyces sp. T-0311]|nr:RNA dependent RNA polymerase-domain-containing protein [Fennellomyces sp. T-0311]
MDMDRMLEKPAEAIRTLLSNIDEFGTTRSMARIIQAGFLEKRDPYIVNLLKMFRVSMLKDLKKKAKILVNKGAFLLGIMDETGTLKEGEVFCQISGASSKGRHKVIQGETVVFRNPCFHPGDIRVVKAVDNPKLHHLVDVLVFSSQGFRDIPSMCSGGDLDGDDYTIFWDEDLIPKTKNYEAMDYTAEAPLRVDEVSIMHICKFFVNYINNDNLGVIANAHLATADRSAKGALDGACLRLAQLHSLAVDFPKSGKPAKLSDDLRVSVFPDFMQKKDKESYESQKVLGKIYREIDKSDYKEYQSQLVDNTVYDVRLRVDNMERYIQEARELKAEYGRDLLALMNQYGVQTEAEIVSGYIIKWLKKGNRKSMHEIQKQTMAAVTNMRKLWRERFDRNLEDELGARHAKAAAWYYVTYHPEERFRDVSEEGKFLSFPWIVDDILCEIAKMNNSIVSEEDRAKPVDDALVKRFGDARKPMQYTMYYSSDEESEGEEDLDELKSSEHDDSESQDENADDEEEITPAIKSFVLTSQPPPKQPSTNISPEITIVKNENHFNVSASEGDEALANALL